VGGGDEEGWEIEREGEVITLKHSIATCIILLFSMCSEYPASCCQILYSDSYLSGKDTNLFVSLYSNVSQVVAHPNIF
jgi:hypothetical protein